VDWSGGVVEGASGTRREELGLMDFWIRGLMVKAAEDGVRPRENPKAEAQNTQRRDAVAKGQEGSTTNHTNYTNTARERNLNAKAQSNPRKGRQLLSQRECFYLPFPCGGFGGLELLPWPWWPWS